MSFWLISLLLASVGSCNSFNFTEAPENIERLNMQNVTVEIGGYQNCNCIYEEFRVRYSTVGLKLTSFLEKLKTRNCSHFQEECKNKSFNFNNFTYLVYEKFCNTSNFINICSEELNTLFTKTGNSTSVKPRMYFSYVTL